MLVYAGGCCSNVMSVVGQIVLTCTCTSLEYHSAKIVLAPTQITLHYNPMEMVWADGITTFHAHYIQVWL